MSSDLLARLRLVRSPGIGPVTFRQLLARFGSAEAALAAVPDLAARGGGRPPKLICRADAEREVAAVDKLGARYLSLGQGLYARLLAELSEPFRPAERRGAACPARARPRRAARPARRRQGELALSA